MADDPYGGLIPVFSRQLQALIAASGGRVRLESGYRSVETQTRLFNEAVARYGSEQAARKWVAPPGKSNHNKGAAGDLAGDLEVAHQLAPQFGLAFPMSWEPWHIELASQRSHAPEDAYTNGGAGTINPTKDDATPAQMAATLAESLIGSNASLSDALENPATGGGVGAVLRGEQVDATNPATTEQPGATTGAASTPSVTGGDVDPAALYKAFKAQGIDPIHAAALVAIAGRESGFRTGAHNDNADTGDDSIGLTQINLLNGGWTSFLQAQGMADPRSELATLDGSVKATAAIYGSSGLTPWGGYKGMPWSHGVDLEVGAAASGGEVTADQLRELDG